MARRKKEEPSGGAGWLATFGDLMNLLLCFFVLLFSMSSVDVDKFEALVQSLQHSFSILPEGGAAVGDGQMVSSGVSQLQFLDEYYKEITNSESEDTENGETGENDLKENGTVEAEEELKEEYSEAALKESEEMEEQIEAMAEQSQITDQIELSASAQYVLITLNGALLFDSGQSEIRKDALPLVNKLAMMLERYNANLIDIEGHTDNVPIKNEQYESNDVLSAYRALAVKDYVLGISQALDASKIHATGCGEYNPVADNSTAEGRARNRRVEIKIYNSYNSN